MLAPARALCRDVAGSRPVVDQSLRSSLQRQPFKPISCCLLTSGGAQLEGEWLPQNTGSTKMHCNR
jgi:hypothetical protein